MARERDVRNAIRDALVATNAFSDVWLTGLPEDSGSGASELTAAAIEPVGTSLATGWDAQLAGGLEYIARVSVTLLARHEDVQLRDELAEQLLEVLKNAVDGATLVAGYTIPGLTRVTHWDWQSPAPPERRIRAMVGFAYLETWQGGDTSQ